MCKRGSSLLSATVQLNCTSTTRASIPSIPLTEREDGENLLLVVTVITMLFFLDSFSPRQERCHWPILVGIRVSFAKFDDNDGFNL